MASKKAKKKATRPAPKKPAAKVARVAKKAAPKKMAVAKKKPSAKKAPARPRGARHQVVHWEIQSKMPEKLHEFYSVVFAWDVDANNSMNYGMVASGGERGIPGGIGGSPTPTPSVVVYADVPDIDATLAKINELGGRTVMPRTDLGPVTLALFQDPEGNTFGLVES